MKRRFVIAAAGAVAATGAAAFLAQKFLHTVDLFSGSSDCDGMVDLRNRIAADFQNDRTVITDRWVLARSEAELLAQIEREGETSAIKTICAGT